MKGSDCFYECLAWLYEIVPSTRANLKDGVAFSCNNAFMFKEMYFSKFIYFKIL